MSLLAGACAQGGSDGDGGGSVVPRDGGGTGRDGGGPVEPCAERGYAATCQDATDVGALASGDVFESDQALIGAVGGQQWLRVTFPPETPPLPDGGLPDGGMPSLVGGGAPAVRFLRNGNDAYRIEIRTECVGVAMCAEGGGPSSPGSASNITEWSFTDTVTPGDEGEGQLSTRETSWPETIYVRVYPTSDPECGTYQLEITR